MPIMGGRSTSGNFINANPQDFVYESTPQGNTAQGVAGGGVVSPSSALAEAATAPNVIVEEQSLPRQAALALIGSQHMVRKAQDSLWSGFLSATGWFYDNLNRSAKSVALSLNPEQDTYRSWDRAWAAAPNIDLGRAALATQAAWTRDKPLTRVGPLALTNTSLGRDIAEWQDAGGNVSDPASAAQLTQDQTWVDNAVSGTMNFGAAWFMDPLVVAGKAAKVARLTYFGRKADAITDPLVVEGSMQRALDAGTLAPLDDPMHALAQTVANAKDEAALVSLDVVAKAASPEQAAAFLATAETPLDALMRIGYLRGSETASKQLYADAPSVVLDYMLTQQSQPFVDALQAIASKKKGAGWSLDESGQFQWADWVTKNDKQKVWDRLTFPANEADLAEAIRVRTDARDRFLALQRGRALFNTSVGGRAYGRSLSKRSDEYLAYQRDMIRRRIDDPATSASEAAGLTAQLTKIEQRLAAHEATHLTAQDAIDKAYARQPMWAPMVEARKAGKETRKADTLWWSQPDTVTYKIPGVAKTVSTVKRAWDEMPSHFVPIKGAGAEDAMPSVKSIIRDVPIYSMRKFGRDKPRAWDGVDEVMTGAERGRWLFSEWMRRASTGAAAPEESMRLATQWLDRRIYEDMVTARGLDDAQQAFLREEFVKLRQATDSQVEVVKGTGGFWQWIEPETGRSKAIHDPTWAAQLANGVQTLPHRQLWDLITDDNVAAMTAYRPSAAHKLRANLTSAGDATMDVWKAAVLLRPTYPVRNTFEGWTRFVANTGGITAFLNAVFSPDMRGTKSTPDAVTAARRAYEKSLDEQDAIRDTLYAPSMLPKLDQMPGVVPLIAENARARYEVAQQIEALKAKIGQDPVNVEARLLDKSPLELATDPGIMYARAINEGNATGIVDTALLQLREAPNGLNPRQVTAYADSLQYGEGFDLPILLNVNPVNGEVRVMDGVHRLMAAQTVGINKVPVRVVVDASDSGPLVRKLHEETRQRMVDDLDIDLGRVTTSTRPGTYAGRMDDAGRTIELADGTTARKADVRGWWNDERREWLDSAEKHLEASQARKGPAVAEWTRQVNAPEPKAWQTGSGQEVRADIAAAYVFPGHHGVQVGSAVFDDAARRALAADLAEQQFSTTVETTLDRHMALLRGRQDMLEAQSIDLLTRIGVIDERTGDINLAWEMIGRPVYVREAAQAGDPIAAQSVAIPTREGMSSFYMPDDVREFLVTHANAQLAIADLRAAGAEVARAAEKWAAEQSGSKLRRGWGMQSATDIIGHSYGFGGVFASPRAGKLVQEEFSSGVTQELMNATSGYTRAADKLGRDYTIVANSVLKPSMGQGYWDGMAHVVNHYFRGDAVADMILKLDPDDLAAPQQALNEFYLFLKSQQGARYRDMFGLDTQADARDWFLKSARQINEMLPGNMELRAKIARGDEVTGTELRAGLDYGDKGPPPITGPEIKSLPGNQNFVKSTIMQRVGLAKDKAFHFLGTLPEDTFLRHPFANYSFNKHMRQLIEQRGGSEISTAELAQMRQSATRLAIRETRSTFYNIVRKHRVLESTRFLAAFAEAQTNSLMFWGKTLAQNPDYVARILQVARAPEQHGLVNSDGDVAIPLPHFLSTHMPAGADTVTVSLDSITSLYFNTSNPENALVGGLMPSPSPIVGLAYSQIARTPAFADVMQHVGDNPVVKLLNAQMTGESTTGEPMSWNRVAPAWLPKLYHLGQNAVFGKDDDSYMMSMQVQAFEADHIRWMMDGGKGREPLPSDEKYRSTATGMALLRIGTNLFAPLGVQWRNEEQRTAASLYQSLTAKYGATEADRLMVQLYPQYVGIMASPNKSSGIASRHAANSWIDKHNDLLTEVGEIDPDAVRLLVPYDTGDFQSEAYVAQKFWDLPGAKGKIRGTVDSEEAARNWQVKLGGALRAAYKERAELEMLHNGIDPDSAHGRAYKDQVSRYTDFLAEKLPAFGEQWNDVAAKDALAGQGLKIMRVVADSAQLQGDPESKQLAATAREFLATRDRYAAMAAGNGPLYYKQNDQVQADYDAMVSMLKAKDTRFSRIYNSYFWWDPLTVTSDGRRAEATSTPPKGKG